MGKVLGAGGFGQVMAATRKKDNLPVSHFSRCIFLRFSSEALQGVAVVSQLAARMVSENISSKNKGQNRRRANAQNFIF